MIQNLKKKYRNLHNIRLREIVVFVVFNVVVIVQCVLCAREQVSKVTYKSFDYT